jgi:hypothetical protein
VFPSRLKRNSIDTLKRLFRQKAFKGVENMRAVFSNSDKTYLLAALGDDAQAVIRGGNSAKAGYRYAGQAQSGWIQTFLPKPRAGLKDLRACCPKRRLAELRRGESAGRDESDHFACEQSKKVPD